MTFIGCGHSFRFFFNLKRVLWFFTTIFVVLGKIAFTWIKNKIKVLSPRANCLENSDKNQHNIFQANPTYSPTAPSCYRDLCFILFHILFIFYLCGPDMNTSKCVLYSSVIIQFVWDAFSFMYYALFYIVIKCYLNVYHCALTFCNNFIFA